MRSNTLHRLVVSTTIAIASLVVSLPASPVGASEKVAAHSNCKTWVRVIDISDNNQHPINWTLVANNGISGVYIKNSEGKIGRAHV